MVGSELEMKDSRALNGGPWRRAEMNGDELRYHGLSLPAGRCSVRAATDDGQSALAELDISAAPGSRGPHRVDLR